jgi:putative methanogenesis marker 16 metalloprotein
MKDIDEINERINTGKAIVLTAEEFKQMVRDGEDIKDVDVVTTATCGLMSGTTGIFSIPISERGGFERAKEVWLNDVPAYPGPCPNERLGIVDMIVYGTSHSLSKPSEYGGGHLFRDIVEGNGIEVEVRTNDDRMIERVTSIDDFEFSRIFTTRSCFKNYMGFINRRDDEVKSIFSVGGMEGPFKEAHVVGCGEFNPLENDHKTIGVGTKILVNGVIGYVIGRGTRSEERPNLSVVADMRGMIPECMGGFITSAGPECITSIAIPIPIIDDDVRNSLKILDEEIALPIADIHDRVPFAESNYGTVWRDTSSKIEFDPERCSDHDVCIVEELCPTRAFSRSRGIDEKRCFNCGACISICPEDAFEGEMGCINVENMKIPITLRQSNRNEASSLAEKLKSMILKEEFLITKPIDYLK